MEPDKKYIRRTCEHCNKGYHFRVRRGFLVRTFLFWLPVRRYLCTNCLKQHYVFGYRNPDQRRSHVHN
jgi:hypothetical protein